jgi:hypothetical protein
MVPSYSLAIFGSPVDNIELGSYRKEAASVSQRIF